MQAELEDTLRAAFSPAHLSITEEQESHFEVTIVCDAFEGKPLLARHRMVNKAIASQLQVIHALQMKTLTTQQWEDKQRQSSSS
jgi:stress-induced morphogen